MAGRVGANIASFRVYGLCRGESLWATCTYVRSSLRPKYVLFGYMDPYTLNPIQPL